MKKTLVMASAIALVLTAVWARPVAAATMDQYRISHLTFNGAVRLPGVALPAGTYTFERVLPGVIRVLSHDRMALYGTFMTIPTLRTERTAKPEVVFGEARVGEPRPIATWFAFPEPASFNYGRSAGNVFLYGEEARNEEARKEPNWMAETDWTGWPVWEPEHIG